MKLRYNLHKNKQEEDKTNLYTRAAIKTWQTIGPESGISLTK